MSHRLAPQLAKAPRRALVGALSEGLVQVQRAGRVLSGATRALEGLVLSACDADELARITDRCYGAANDRRTALFTWEQAWFERDLPQAKANLLLGGCGNGRELRWLHDRGYRTCAFDPVVSHPAGPILQGRYEDLLDPTHPVAVALRARAPFDGIVLGWGSFTHVPRADTRLAVLRALRDLSDGPLLLSYWTVGSHGAGESRARALGQALGARLAGRQATASDPNDRVMPHCGYAHCFTEPELRALAAEAGYAASCYADGYPHATLRPR